MLKNLLGIKQKSEMDAAEYKALRTVQLRYLHEGVVTQVTHFDAALVCQMHRDWLGGIYEWAGTYRTVELEKEGFRWPPAYLVSEHMARFDTDVISKHTPCRPGQLKDVCLSIAIVHAELLLIHPFREGNGRLARWLADLMAVQANLLPAAYEFSGKGSRSWRKRYLNAVVEGYGQCYSDLADFFEDAILLSLREAL